MTDALVAKYKKIRNDSNNRMIGKRFGRLVVLRFTREGNSHHKYFLCRCDCGSEKEVSRTHLVTGKTSSCGCLWQQNKREYRKIHGESKTKLYGVWSGIKERCTNKNCTAYKNYGGRGIFICKEWMDYPTFRNWALSNGYKEGLEINRINNSGGYSEENCNFVTPLENSHNKRTNIFVAINGITKTMSEWARIYGISPGTANIRYRKLGWDIIDSVTIPKGARSGKRTAKA